MIAAVVHPSVRSSGELTRSPMTSRCEHAIQHRGVEQHLDRVKAGDRERQPQQHGHGNHQVESGRPPRPVVEAARPCLRFGDRIRRRSGKDRDGEHARTDNAEREQQVRAAAGDGPQRLGGVLRGGDRPRPVCMHGGGRCQDDEVHHEVREEHSRDHVLPGDTQLLVGGALTFLRCELAARNIDFDFLRRLPEKEVRADGRAEDADEHGEERTRPLHVRNERGAQDGAPVRSRQEGRDHVHEQHERQPLEDAGDHAIR